MIEDSIFFVAFVITIGITLLKLYNVMSRGKLYDIKLTFVIFAGYLMAYGFQFFTFLLFPETLLYLILFKFSTFLVILNIFFLIAEIFFEIETQAKKPIEAHKSNKLINIGQLGRR